MSIYKDIIYVYKFICICLYIYRCDIESLIDVYTVNRTVHFHVYMS